MTRTISADGLYTLPATIPSPNTLKMTAVTAGDASGFRIADVVDLNPMPVVSSAQATQTVAGAASYSLDVMGSGFISTSQLQAGGAAVPSTLVSSIEWAAPERLL